jgi:hypothetical protein
MSRSRRIDPASLYYSPHCRPGSYEVSRQRTAALVASDRPMYRMPLRSHLMELNPGLRLDWGIGLRNQLTKSDQE